MTEEQKAARRRKRKFKKIAGTVKDMHRMTTMTLTLETYGTREQVDQAVKKIEDELALQGLEVTLSNVQTFD